MIYKLDKPIQAEISPVNYRCTIEWRNGSFISDEPLKTGGNDAGPDPFSLMLSSVAACTLITLRMFIEREGWDIPQIAVETNYFQTSYDENVKTVIDRDIRFLSPVTEEQRERLTDIARHCPVSKMMEGEVVLRTYAYNEDTETATLEYTNGETTVLWKPHVCKHSGRCVSQLHHVFDLSRYPWIDMQGATNEEIIRQVGKCPTGAISIKKKE